MSPEYSAQKQNLHEFSPQIDFSHKLGTVVNRLFFLEKNWPVDKHLGFKTVKQQLIQELDLHKINKDERQLFNGVFKLFALKNGLGSENGALLERSNGQYKGTMIGFLGPLGVSKTTLARNLAKGLDTNLATVEPHEKNPFWRAQQDNAKENYFKYMLRSQIYFLISNINSDIKARLSPGLTISDTSILTDILMWARWYNKTGKFNDKEYQTYKKLVNLLQPIIPKPDLLVVLKPDTIEHLKQGIIERQAHEHSRTGELNFAQPDNNDLLFQMNSIDDIADSLINTWGVKISKFLVNPIDIYKNHDIQHDINYQVMGELHLLHNLLQPKPEEVVKQTKEILSSAKESQLIMIHSKSMFSGKTAAECLLAKKLGLEKIIVFQPKASLRSKEEAFDGQETHVISRNGLRIPAITTEGNSLMEILEYVVVNKITPDKTPYIFIDEIMLFTDQEKKPREAIDVLESLRKIGFQIVIDGIDYTFQEKPFTFMIELLKEIDKNKNWHGIETSTRCRYCDLRAKGTRLWLIYPDGTKKIAPRNYSWNHPGSSAFDPVCCEKHKSYAD